MTHPPGQQGQPDRRDEHDATEFGVSLMCLFFAVFFVFCALYLGPYPDLSVGELTIPVSAVVKWFCYIVAVASFVFFLGFWGVATRNSKEMGTFFKSLWGGGERGWKYASQTVWFIAAAFVAHLLVALLFYLSGLVWWLGWLEYVAWVAQLSVILMALFASVSLGYACDAFFVHPVLETTRQGGDAFTALVQNVRKRATVVIPILIALIALFIELR